MLRCPALPATGRSRCGVGPCDGVAPAVFSRSAACGSIFAQSRCPRWAWRPALVAAADARDGSFACALSIDARVPEPPIRASTRPGRVCSARRRSWGLSPSQCESGRPVFGQRVRANPPAVSFRSSSNVLLRAAGRGIRALCVSRPVTGSEARLLGIPAAQPCRADSSTRPFLPWAFSRIRTRKADIRRTDLVRFRSSYPDARSTWTSSPHSYSAALPDQEKNPRNSRRPGAADVAFSRNAHGFFLTTALTMNHRAAHRSGPRRSTGEIRPGRLTERPESCR